MSIHGKPRAKALAAIPNCEPFSAGGRAYGVPNFRGESVSTLPSTGSLPDTERTLLHADYLASGIDYVVWSYQTPIAWHMLSGQWHVVDEKFSVTTTKHQHLTRCALVGADVRSMS